jgi:hypothetical protein
LGNNVYPPQTKAKGTRAKGAKHAFDSLIKDIVVNRLRTELDEFGQTVYAWKTSNGSSYPNSLDNSPDDSFIISMLNGLEQHAPKLMQLLTAISELERQRTPSVRADRRVSNPYICAYMHTNIAQVIISVICQLVIQQKHSYCYMQKLLAMFFKAKATPVKVVDLLSQLGICMTYRWSTEAIKDFGKRDLGDLINY